MVGNPLDHLPTMPVRPGTVAVMAVLLGSTASTASPNPRDFLDRNSAAAPLVGGSGGGSALGPWVCWSSSSRYCGVKLPPPPARRQGDTEQRRELPGRLAHCLIPIVVGYLRPLPVLSCRARPGNPLSDWPIHSAGAGSCSGSTPPMWSISRR